jgi:putative copper resistance protein D
MGDGPIAWIGLGLELLAGIAYVRAARRKSPRGHRWPVSRTATFLAGLIVIAIALDSGISARDDLPTDHMLQHSLLMMVAPLLLALGAPITLAMRTVQGSGRRRLRAILRDPSVRGLVTRPGVLIADYNLAMAVVLIAPVRRLAGQQPALHAAIHGYLVVCGFLFWTAVLARDPVPGRLARSERVRAAALSIPLNLALATAVALAPGVFIGAGNDEGGAAVLAVAATATSAVGIGSISSGRRVRRPVIASS